MRVPLLVLALAAAPAGAQVPLLAEGSTVDGFGPITDLGHAAINASDGWVSYAWVAAPPFDSQCAVFRDGVQLVVTGDLLAGSGLAFGSASKLGVDGSGQPLWIGESDAEPFAFPTPLVGAGDRLVRAAGDLCGAPEAPAGTTYVDFDDLEFTAAGHLLVTCKVAYPGDPPGWWFSALALFRVDPFGNLLGENLVLQFGDSIPGQTDTVASIGPGDGADVNSSGQLLLIPTLFLTQKVLVDAQVLAESSGPSPIAGESWSYFLVGQLNDAGDHVYGGRLNPSGDDVLIRNGQKLVQTGDALASLGGQTVEAVGLDAVALAETGEVAWIGEARGEDVLFIDHEPLLSTGDVFGGQTVDYISPRFEIHPTGRSVVVELGFEGTNLSAIYELFLPSLAPLDGCFGNQGQLALASGAPEIGSTLGFELDAGQAPGVTAALAVSVGAIAGWPPCGLPLPGAGELLIDVSAPNPVAVLLGAAPWAGAPVPIAAGITPDLYGVELFWQGAFIDFAGLTPSEPVRLTDALVTRIGL
ncbi:MAG: hypothetical protein AAF682_12455 [Planctomycetota bacterium]